MNTEYLTVEERKVAAESARRFPRRRSSCYLVDSNDGNATTEPDEALAILADNPQRMKDS